MRVRNAQAANSYVRGFDVVLARDCVGAWSDDDMRRTLAAVEAISASPERMHRSSVRSERMERCAGRVTSIPACNQEIQKGEVWN
jgi:hypothetical protein